MVNFLSHKSESERREGEGQRKKQIQLNAFKWGGFWSSKKKMSATGHRKRERRLIKATERRIFG